MMFTGNSLPIKPTRVGKKAFEKTKKALPREAVGPDGWIYFAKGPTTNSAVVGLDNWKLGWLT
jgi:hypothetical protein